VRLFILCAAFLTLAARTLAAADDRVYTVERGDTLSGDAHTHGIPLSRLAEHNKLSVQAPIHAGQQLLLPVQPGGRATAVPAPARGGLPLSVQNAIDTAHVQPGRWKYIVIHHSGVNTGTVAGMDRYHREVRHMENGLAYHFVIGNDHGLGDGEIGVGSRWTRQLDGGHLISEEQNKFSLGICLVGNFETGRPTARQMERLTALLRALLVRCQLSPTAIRTHQQINLVYTRCPGRNFPWQTLLASLGRSRPG
jgi:LysM repeat protein